MLDLVLPRCCFVCGVPGAAWCRGCRPRGVGPVVGGGPVAVRAAGAYRGSLREAVLRYKERGRRDLIGPLAALLAGVLADLSAPLPIGSRVLLVPVPSARRAAAVRGGDHVLRLARRAAGLAGVRCARGVLELRRAVADSSGLDVEARARNLAGAFGARRAPPAPPAPPAPAWSVIIVDDVITTGATVREAHRALISGGWTVVGAAVLAATPRRHPVRSPPPRGASVPLAPPR